MVKEIELRSLSEAHAKEIAALHFQAFKGFFLTSLGRTFLKTFYKAVLLHKDAVSIGAFQDGELVGFAIGTRKQSGFYKSIMKRKALALLLAALPALISKPRKIIRLSESFSNTQENEYSKNPCLLSICVHPNVGAQGVGKMVLIAFEKKLIELNLNSLILSTDSYQNVHVNQFYKNNNYIFVNTFLQGKREMNLYYKQLVS